MGTKTAENWPEHPLFPSEDDEIPKRVEFIQVIRHEDGRSKQIPRVFRAAELQSLEDIYKLWGGGVYELWGRQASIHNPESHGRITANRRYEIAGISKPLSVDGSNTVAPATPAPAAAAAPPAAPPSSGAAGMSDQVLIAIMQGQQQAQQNFAAMMLQMMQQGRADQSQMMTTLLTLSSQQQQSMVGMMTAMLSAKGGGTEDVAKIAELFKTLGVIGPKGDDDDGGGGESIGEIISNVADIVEGAVQLKTGMPTPMGGNPNAPPGSAAAVLGAPAVPIKKPDAA